MAIKKIIRIVFIGSLGFILFFIIKANSRSLFAITYCDENFNCRISFEKSHKDYLFRKYDKYKYVKLDKIMNEKNIDDLSSLINDDNKYQFGYGLDINNKIKILSEEINSNYIIDYKNKNINFEKLNEYLSERNININNDDLGNIKIFDTESSWKEGDEFSELSLYGGFHIKNHDDIDLIIKNAAEQLISMINSDGSFTYGYRANTGKIINSYNILRHAGSIYSLIKYYEYHNDDNVRATIDQTIDYLLKNYTIDYDKNTTLIIENDEIELGGNGLTLLALAEYQIAFDDSKYSDIAEKLANGIIFLQEDDGSFNHVLNKDYSIKEKFRTVYYDGEATFGLLKLYGITKNQKYYDHAKKTIDMFIRNDYTNYQDHWVSYSMNEFLKYNDDDIYIKFALDNYSKNNFDGTDRFRPTVLELLTVTAKTYNSLIKNNKIIDNFDIDKLIYSIEFNKNILLKYYIDNEYLIYFKPSNIKSGFMSTKNNFRMRIDDIQHAISGLITLSSLIGT